MLIFSDHVFLRISQIYSSMSFNSHVKGEQNKLGKIDIISLTVK